MQFRSFTEFLTNLGAVYQFLLLIGIFGLFLFWGIRHLLRNRKETPAIIYLLSIPLRIGGVAILSASIGAFWGTQLGDLLNLKFPYIQYCISICAGIACVIGFRIWQFIRNQQS